MRIKLIRRQRRILALGLKKEKKKHFDMKNMRMEKNRR